MNRQTASAAFAVALAAALLAPAPATAREPDTICTAEHVDVRYLPHTADAIEGWFANCRRTTGPPSTPDAAAAWLG